MFTTLFLPFYYSQLYATQNSCENTRNLWAINFPIWANQPKYIFLTFPACFKIPIIFSSLNSNCSNLLDMRNLQEQVKKAFCYQKLFWPFTVWINSRPSASNSKSFSQSLEQFCLTVGQNNLGNKIQKPEFKIESFYCQKKVS